MATNPTYSATGLANWKLFDDALQLAFNLHKDDKTQQCFDQCELIRQHPAAHKYFKIRATVFQGMLADHKAEASQSYWTAFDMLAQVEAQFNSMPSENNTLLLQDLRNDLKKLSEDMAERRRCREYDSDSDIESEQDEGVDEDVGSQADIGGETDAGGEPVVDGLTMPVEATSSVATVQEAKAVEEEMAVGTGNAEPNNQAGTGHLAEDTVVGDANEEERTIRVKDPSARPFSLRSKSAGRRIMTLGKKGASARGSLQELQESFAAQAEQSKSAGAIPQPKQQEEKTTEDDSKKQESVEQ